ncbi:MAG TPA: aquaporin [Candidatus Acidoferrales bacterium]|nr:aquaporin [Candidatus Acidoferrales bacterium]
MPRYRSAGASQDQSGAAGQVAGTGPSPGAPEVTPHNHLQPLWLREFHDPSHEWRRLFAEVFGTFLLVTVAAGGPVVGALSHGAVGRGADVVAPGLMVLAIILFMGKVSGAHLNPAVSVAFALRRDFPWKRVPGYIGAQLVGATLACLFLSAVLGQVGLLGATVPGAGISSGQALLVEALLTMGLVSTILGTASGAQNVGALSAIAVGSYIALAGLWASPISGASMNPARSFGPDFVIHNFATFWVYLVGPILGALVAVGAAYILRGPGGQDRSAEMAAQGVGFGATPWAVPSSAPVPVEGTKL